MQTPAGNFEKPLGYASMLDQVEPTGSDPGYYGTRPLSLNERFCLKASCTFGCSSGIPGNGLVQMKPVSLPFDFLTTLAPIAFIREVLAEAKSTADPQADRLPPTFTLVTQCFRDDVDFIRCATALAIFASGRAWHTSFVWLVEYDGTIVDEGSLGKLVPPSLKALVSFHDIHDPRSPIPLGDAVLKDAFSHWVVHLPVTDELCSEAFEALSHYIQTFVACRCILSRRDSTGTWAHPTHADEPSGIARIFDLDWDSNHTVVLRVDLWNALCCDETMNHVLDDHALALRAALKTHVLLIPDRIAKRWDPTFSPTSLKFEAGSRRNARKRFIHDLADRFDRSTASPGGLDRPRVSKGLCIIRTQGRNLELLTEAVQSVKEQTIPVTACVVVHGSQDLHSEIVRWLIPDGMSVVVLSAWRKNRQRGYPLNVGLDYLHDHSSTYDFFCFLDDDDIIYPFFAERLTAKLFMAQADLAYALTNQRVPWETAVAGHTAKPTSLLIAGNFIPINSYVARTSALNVQKTRFRDDLGYLEDWDFLLQMLGHAAKIAHLPEVLSEYRITSDGNIPQKIQQSHYDDCFDRVLALGRTVAVKLKRHDFLRDLADFVPGFEQSLSDEEINLSKVAWSMICEEDNNDI